MKKLKYIRYLLHFFVEKNNGKFFKTIFLKEKNIHKNKNIFSLYNIHGLTSLKKEGSIVWFHEKTILFLSAEK